MYFHGPNEPDRAKEVPIPLIYLTHPYQSRSPEYIAEIKQGMINTYCAFAKGRKTYIVAPIPELKINVPKTMGRAMMLGNVSNIGISLDEYSQRHQITLHTLQDISNQCGTFTLDPLPYLCSSDTCSGQVNGMPIYFDADHLSERGAQLLSPMFKSILSKTIMKNK